MPSVKDVAKLAGVGVGTVSRVINHANVKDSTRERVERAIKTLNYIPNEVARNFKMQTSKIVALLIPSVWHPFFSELAYYIEDELDSHGYKLMLCNSGGKPEKEVYYLDMLSQNKVAGILGITYNDTNLTYKTNIPIVSIDRHFTENVVCVSSDNFDGGRIAARELVKSGCKNIAFMGAFSKLETETGNRRKGFVFEAERQNIRHSVYEEEDPITDPYAFIGRFVEKYPDVDGVFAITDIFAAQFIQFVERMGRRVPQDVQVIGYDGIQDSDLFHPILSTICQPVEQMARASVQSLLKIINGEEILESKITIPVCFKKGETTR